MTEHNTSGGLTALAAEAENARLRAEVEALADKWEERAGERSEAWRVFGPQTVSVPFAVASLRAALDSPTSHTQQEAEVVKAGRGDDSDVEAGRCCPHCRNGLTDHNRLVWNAGYAIGQRHARADALAADTTNPAPTDQETP